MGFWDRFRRTPDDDTRPTYADKLRAAAGNGIARIRCHQDTWDYFVDEFEKTKSNRGSHVFRTRSEDIGHEDEGMILVRVSGTTLAALLDRSQHMAFQYGTSYSDLDKAIGARVSQGILRALDHVVPAAEANGSEVTIVLDDRPVPKPE